MKERYLVTGGAGFIGSHVADELLRRGCLVRVIDNFSTGRRKNLAQIAGDVELVEGDIRSYERVHNAVKGSDIVIHLAALPSVPRSVQDPLTSNEVNITGTLNVLLASRDEGVGRLVFASSSSVYGADRTLPKHEGLVPQPISPYAVSKLAAEQYVRSFHVIYGLETTALRFFNVFGPRQDPESQYSGVVPLFMRLAMEGGEPTIFGDGTQTRDFTYVANVVDAVLAATTSKQAVGTICNVACGEGHTLMDLVAAVGAAAGRELTPMFKPVRTGDVKHSYADISEGRRVLGYAPSISFDEGIRLTYDDMRRERQRDPATAHG